MLIIFVGESYSNKEFQLMMWYECGLMDTLMFTVVESVLNNPAINLIDFCQVDA